MKFGSVPTSPGAAGGRWARRDGERGVRAP